MKKWLKNSIRFLLVIVGIVLLTSFTIDATDTLQGSQTALSIFSEKLTANRCPKDMSQIDGLDYSFCVDKYENSANSGCSYTRPKSILDTTVNISDAKCLSVSEEGKLPWTFVAKPQAEQICAKAGKRLLSAEEWFAASLGTPDSVSNCNLAGQLDPTGTATACISGSGIYDMVGNAWELINASSENGKYLDRDLPDEGYVTRVDDSGIALETDNVPNPIYNDDYFWSKKEGVFTMLRGGFYGSKSDGGIYTTYAQTDVNFASAAIGFRCAKSLQ